MTNNIINIKDKKGYCVTEMICDKCNYSWVAVHPLSATKLECDKCKYFTELVEYKEEINKVTIKKQTKLESLIEAKINTIVGFILSTLVWHYIVPLIWPAMAPHATWGKAIWITILFTFVSVVRNYFIRRYFEWRKFNYAKS